MRAPGPTFGVCAVGWSAALAAAVPRVPSPTARLPSPPSSQRTSAELGAHHAAGDHVTHFSAARRGVGIINRGNNPENTRGRASSPRRNQPTQPEHTHTPHTQALCRQRAAQKQQQRTHASSEGETEREVGLSALSAGTRAGQRDSRLARATEASASAAPSPQRGGARRPRRARGAGAARGADTLAPPTPRRPNARRALSARPGARTDSAAAL